MAPTLTWISDERCVVGDTTFQTIPTDFLSTTRMSREGSDFILFKDRPLVELYAKLLKKLRPRRIVELGILEGGGTAFLLELARPRRMVAIDQKPPRQFALRDYISRRGLEEVVDIRDHVDQADRAQLADIAKEAFGDDPLDLVVDDCSHMYAATRSSFNELFPRLRPGGLYLIEDWLWAHAKLFPDLWPDQVPLSRLVLELVLASASNPGLISQITIDFGSVQVTRGDKNVDPLGFDISACLDHTGQSLLRSDERVAASVRASSEPLS